MCGIIGGYNVSLESCKLGLKEIQYRGKDGNNTIEFNKSIIGHCLHAIVNNVAQPLIDKKTNSAISINCEIYNWKELEKGENDSESVLNELNKLSDENLLENIKELLKKFDGVYAASYIRNNKIYLFRDLIGVKPIWYVNDNKYFIYGSEKKAIEKIIESEKLEIDKEKITELNPRTIIEYNTKTNELKETRREFFKTTPEIKKSKDKILEELEKLFLNAILKRVPDKKIGLGILFSGGIDSTILAYILKKHNIKFTCYTAALDETSQDLQWSKKIAKELDLDLKIAIPKEEELEKHIKKVCKIIESSNVVKVGVALPFYLATELAKKDKIKVIFSGLGSEEIFAGYKRHEESLKINEECKSGLLKMYERDLYRDDTITMHNNVELRLPFLDLKLIKYALRIPSEFKIQGEAKKLILRDLAKKLELKEEFAQRKKLAAQYGSKFDKALERVAKKNGFEKKSEYLNQFYETQNEKLGVLYSSGKDSNYAMQIMKSKNYSIKCLITLQSSNPDSYMFQTVGTNLAKVQAEALDIPLITHKTKGEKEKELKDLEEAIKIAKEKYNIEGIVTGALFSNYQRNRIEKICDKLNLKIFSPLWHMNQESEMENIIRQGFKVILIKIAGDGLNKNWLGKILEQKDLDKLKELNKKMGFNVAGEGGEFESFVLDMPMFKKKIEVKGQIEMENEYTGEFRITETKLIDKK
ncbi:diphthine--ammonia ligase [Candidatus Woesearchaeota archaeon]|nr:diphthine--ammonia ligase [Candidatus Woesearchaeota archaeon]